MIRILNAEPLGYSETARDILRQVGTLDEADLIYSEILTRIAEYDVLIVRLRSQIDNKILDAGKRLKVIVTATTGLDHIDIHYATEKGVSILSLQGQTEFLRTIVATAEHTWALLLALTRQVPWAYESVLEGRWERDEFRGHDLKGRRLGVVGFGRIGEKIGRYGQAFGLTVLAYDPSPLAVPDYVMFCATLDELLPQSDILSIHVPLNSQTVGLIGLRELALLPQGALLVNTSRGAIVDEKALLVALCEGKLGGAALDVLQNERTDNSSSPLVHYAQTRKNLILTPHIGGATHESMAATEIFMASQLQRFIHTQMG